MLEFFDWKYYINKYPDLIKNGINSEDKAKQHWENYGCKEGRKCNQIKSNHLDLYPELRDNCINTEDEAIYHWLNYGYFEGKISNKIILESKINNEFDWKFYYNMYNDLKYIDINSEFAIDRLNEHYMTKGIKENRIISKNHFIQIYYKKLLVRCALPAFHTILS